MKVSSEMKKKKRKEKGEKCVKRSTETGCSSSRKHNRGQAIAPGHLPVRSPVLGSILLPPLGGKQADLLHVFTAQLGSTDTAAKPTAVIQFSYLLKGMIPKLNLRVPSCT